MINLELDLNETILVLNALRYYYKAYIPLQRHVTTVEEFEEEMHREKMREEIEEFKNKILEKYSKNLERCSEKEGTI